MKSQLKLILMGVLLLLLTINSRPGKAQEPLGLENLSFSNQTEAANVGFVHATTISSSKESGFTHMGGAAAGDFNNDGWVDLFVTGGGLRADALFINQGNGTFLDMAEPAGLAELHVGTGAAVGDYNNDGWLDIYVTSYGHLESMGPGQNRLYHNNGDGSFINVAVAAGVNQTSPDVADGLGASFGDYDLDGNLDLFVTGWHKNSKGNRLFRNNGDSTFDDATNEAHIIDDGVRGFSPCFANMDDNHHPELLLVADGKTSKYYFNKMNGSFTEVSHVVEVGQEWNGMGSTVGDFNNDGLLDWYVTAIYDDNPPGRGYGNKLYYNQSNHIFEERAKEAGVDDGGWGWGAVAVDLNHDGWLDLVETNGWHLEEYTNELSKMWLNNGAGSFEEVAQEVGFEHTLNGRGLLSFDYDNDGDQDLVVTALNDKLQLYRNDLSGPNTNWLRVFLDPGSKAELAANGFGSRVSVRAGDQTYYRDITGCPHFLTQSELSAHFGLGAAQTIDELRVEWSDGSVTSLSGVEINQTITIMADVGVATPPQTLLPITSGILNNSAQNNIDSRQKYLFFNYVQ